jgi:hypothetical protein
MPEKKTLERARRDKREGKAPTTQAGEFVREEMEHAKEGKHPVKNRKQAIAIGLSKARRAGVAIPDKGKKSTAKKSTSAKSSASKSRSSHSHSTQSTSRKRTASKRGKSTAAHKRTSKKTASHRSH